MIIHGVFMLSSPRQRAKSRLEARSVATRAHSRLKARSTRLVKSYRFRRYLTKFWQFLRWIGRLLSRVQWFDPTFNRLELKSLAVAIISWVLTGVILNSVTPSVVADIPPSGSYWPLVLVLAWDIYWLGAGLGLARPLNWALTGTVSWWLWLRLHQVTTNLELVFSIVAVVVIIYLHTVVGEKYLFSRKSIRKGILR